MQRYIERGNGLIVRIFGSDINRGESAEYYHPQPPAASRQDTICPTCKGTQKK